MLYTAFHSGRLDQAMVGNAHGVQRALQRFLPVVEGAAQFHTDAREKMLRGVDILANAKVTLGPKGRNVVIDKSFVSATNAPPFVGGLEA